MFAFRFVNTSAQSFYDVSIPGLTMTVVHVHGNDVDPVPVDQFRIGVAETYDVIVEPREDRAYTVFAQNLTRSGFSRGTLAPRPGMSAAIPPLDAAPLRNMADMGMTDDAGADRGLQPGPHPHGRHHAGDERDHRGGEAASHRLSG